MTDNDLKLKTDPWEAHNPIHVPASGLERGIAIRKIVSDYERQGYALFHYDGHELGHSGEQAISNLAMWLNLGLPFVPPVYRSGPSELYKYEGINRVSANPIMSESHVGFSSQNELELHTDGTLQRIGEIPSTLLFCVNPAVQGGDTIIFNAVAAFKEIMARHPNFGFALLNERALERHAPIGGRDARSLGPVFAERDDEILNRYSVSQRDFWMFTEVQNLRHARTCLAELAKPHSPLVAQFRVAAGQGILIANDKVSHGRTSFTDDPMMPRLFLRALFNNRPQQPST
jgi:hypothetical protein